MTNMFTTGTPMEEACPEAHNAMLNAARFLSQSRDDGMSAPHRAIALDRADTWARGAATTLHAEYMTGHYTVWLAVVRHAVELHAARLDAERDRLRLRTGA